MRRRAVPSSAVAPLLAALLATACSVGCGGTSSGGDGAGATDDTGGASADSASVDDADAAGAESGGDSSPVDTGAVALDSGAADTGDLDTASPETGALDTGAADTGALDAGAADSGAADDGLLDAAADGGPVDAGADAGGALDPCSGAGLCTIDTDLDTIPDSVEGRCAAGGPVDTDKDGIPDYQDADSDNDTIRDKPEWAGGGCDPTVPLNDADGDGVPNFRDDDSDDNGLKDVNEGCPPLGMPGRPVGCAPLTPADFDGDGVADFLDSDNDHDSSSSDLTIGLEDKYELTDSAGKYVGLVDTDKDGVPDLWDRDADEDQIFDLDDGLGDPDKDTLANFRDIDSDDDGVRDWCEARANPAPTEADLPRALLDTNADGTPDYLQRDTDGDLLLDGAGALGDPINGEDKNGNCIVDATETDRLKADTDGDGVSDFIEVTLVGVACAKDPTCTPASKGLFYFIEPYSPDGSAKPTPTSSPLALSTTLNNGDVGFIMDTTGSMGSVIAALRTSLSTTIIPALKAKIPSLGLGVAAHDDVPYGGYGSPGTDLPYYNTSPAGFVTTDTTLAQTAVNSLTTHYGSDTPESQVEALYHAVAGDALVWPTGSVAADFGAPGSTFGALHFRSTALPILVEMTDAHFHNGRWAKDTSGTSYGPIHDPYSFPTFDIDGVVTKFNALGAKFMGVAADNGGRLAGFGFYGCPYCDEAYIADKTGSTVPPSAFGAGSTTCKTGVSGAALAPDGPGGSCRLVFSINHDGNGLSTSIVDGVTAILASIKFDTYVQAYNDPAATIDVVGDFMLKVEPQPTGGTDPVTGGVCVTFPPSQLADKWSGPKALIAGADGVNDTIKQVNPGSLYCFNVVPQPNVSIAAKSTAQVFTAWLKVLAAKPSGGTFTLGTDRKVLFVVPPISN